MLITDIGVLSTQTERGDITDAAMVLEGDHIVWVGERREAPAADSRWSVSQRCVIPGFVDSHAHLVFAGERSAEFAARMAGRPYTAGGIATTVEATRAAPDEVLRRNVASLADELLRSGVTTFEIKSGYGLTSRDEERSLRIASEFTDETTYLGAHVVAPEYHDDVGGYVELVTGEMLDQCRPHAKWIDVFCDRGAFDADQARTILRAGMNVGLLPRLHANQLQHGPGVQLAVELGAASVDHCTYLDAADIAALADSNTVATLLPGAEFSTRSPYPDARRLLDAGVTVAIATDCNPGSSFTTSMPWCVAVAVREMMMTPDEAVGAATLGGARALRRDDVGYLAEGARADFVVVNAPNPTYLAYRPGVDLIGEVWRGGDLVHGSSRMGDDD